MSAVAGAVASVMKAGSAPPRGSGNSPNQGSRPQSTSQRPRLGRNRSAASQYSTTSTESAAGPANQAYDFGANPDNLVFTWQQRIFLFFDDPSSSAGARAMSIFIMLLIVLSSISFVVETLPDYKPKPGEDAKPAFVWIEAVCIVIFSIEYLSRLFTAASFMSMVDRHAKMLWRVTVHDGDFDDDESAALVASGDAGAGSVQSASRQRREAADAAQAEVDGDGDGDEPHRTTVCMSCRYTWRFAKQILNIIDLLAIVPWYIELITVATSGGGEGAGGGLAVFRILRLARVFRVFKLGKYSAGMQTFGRVLTKSKDALYLMMFFVSLAVVLFGSMIYFAEAGSYDETTGKYMRPDKWGSGEEESPFTSIPASFWWVVVTTTTVGFGDLYPTTTAGKLVAAATMHVGILVLALPITIIGANFALEYEQDDDDAAYDDMMDNMLVPTPPIAPISMPGDGLYVSTPVSVAPELSTIAASPRHGISANSLNSAGSAGGISANSLNSAGSAGSGAGSFHFGANAVATTQSPTATSTTGTEKSAHKAAKQRRRAELTAFIAEMRQLCGKAEAILQTATTSSSKKSPPSTVVEAAMTPSTAAAAVSTSSVRLSDIVAANKQ